MNLQAIAEFQHYLSSSRNKKIYFKDDDNILMIRPSLFNSKIILDLGLISAVTLSIPGTASNQFAYFCAYLFFFIMLWIDLQSLNSLVINLSRRSLQLKRINPIERLVRRYFLQKNDLFEFGQVSAFSFRSNEGFTRAIRKYFVEMTIKEGQKFALFSFSEENNATQVAHFLSKFIKG